MIPRHSLAVRATLLILAAAFLPALVLSIVFYTQMKKNIIQSVDASMTGEVEEIRHDVSEQLDIAVSNVAALSANPVLQAAADPEAMRIELSRVQTLYKSFEDISYVSPDGVVLASTNYNYRGNWRHKAWFRKAKYGSIAVSPVHFIPNPLKTVMAITAPVVAPDGSIAGVVAGQLNMQQIWSVVDRGRPVGGTAFLVDSTGSLIAHPDKNRILYKYSPELLSVFEKERQGHVGFKDAQGKSRICWFETFPTTRLDRKIVWRVGLEKSQEEAHELVYRVQQQIIFFILIWFPVAVLIAFFFQQWVSKPVRRLITAVQRVAAGEMDQRVKVRGRDELSELGEAFNRMTDNLARTMASRDELAREVERRVKVEQELEHSRQVLQAVLEHMPVGVVIIGADRRIHQANPEALKILGMVSRDDVVGQQCSGLLCRGCFEDCLVDGFEGRVQMVETTMQTKDGVSVPVIRGVLPIVINGEKTIVETFVDITDRVVAERKMREAKDLAEEANRMKGQFVSNVSHDLRTPLNCILGFADMVTKSASLEDARTRGRTIIKEAETLLRLVNDLLDSAKLESGKLTLEHVVFDVVELMEGVQRSLSPQASQKGIELKILLRAGVPRRIKSDSLRLRQIVMNLVSNAVKFTEKGHVQLSLDAQELAERRVGLRISVEDTGVGIPKDKQKEIFERFSQADKTVARRFGGTGLGMSIARQLVEMMGGEIRLESEPGRGSTFWFTIPVELADGESAAMTTPESAFPKETKESPSVSRNILVAEDYETNQDLVRIHLETAGHKVRIVSDGIQAVAACRQEEFDVIFLDLQMPYMDGLAAAERIRVESPFCQDKPILLLTANTSESLVQACKHRGVDELFLKPIRRQNLLDAVQRWAGQKRS